MGDKKILEPSGVEVQLNIQIKIKIPKSQSESYSIPKNHKSRLKGHEFSLHLQNQDKKSIFWTGVYHRPVTIYKSKSICQNLTRNPQHPQKKTKLDLKQDPRSIAGPKATE